MERKLRNLAKGNQKAYVYLSNEELGMRFLKQAESEGFRFGDGAAPTQRMYEEIMAVNPDLTINYVGTYGRVAFGAGASQIGSTDLIRIDYEKFVNGEEDYFYKK